MKGISILLALIIGTFSHTGYFNRAANTAERAIRKMSGVVLVGRIILNRLNNEGSGAGPENEMPVDPESAGGEDIAAEASGEENGETGADITAETQGPGSGADGEAKPEEEAEPEISIEIIIDPDDSDPDSTFGNGGKGLLLFEFEDQDAMERKEQFPDC